MIGVFYLTVISKAAVPFDCDNAVQELTQAATPAIHRSVAEGFDSKRLFSDYPELARDSARGTVLDRRNLRQKVAQLSPHRFTHLLEQVKRSYKATAKTKNISDSTDSKTPQQVLEAKHSKILFDQVLDRHFSPHKVFSGKTSINVDEFKKYVRAQRKFLNIEGRGGAGDIIDFLRTLRKKRKAATSDFRVMGSFINGRGSPQLGSDIDIFGQDLTALKEGLQKWNGFPTSYGPELNSRVLNPSVSFRVEKENLVLEVRQPSGESRDILLRMD